jgi:hypothetical protein
LDKPKKKYRFIRSLVVIIIVGFGIKYFLYDFTASFVGDLLFEFVKLRENDRYEYRNKSVSYFPFERKLLISNLSITPKPDLQATETSYSVKIPSLFIDIESLWEVYRHQRLSITGVTMTEPNVQVHSIKKERDESTRIQLEAGELYQVISQYLRHLQIGEFDVKNGSISFARNDNHPFEVHNFNLEIEEFLMDSVNLEQHKNIFYTESINIHLAKQEFELEDSNRKFSFDSLIFSSRDSSFQILDFKLYHMGGSDAEDSISVDKLAFSGIDLNALYNEEVIDLGPMRIESPYVHLRTTRRSKKKPEFVNPSKYKMIVDAVAIVDGSVAISNSNINLRAENININHGQHQILSGGPFMDPLDFVNESVVSMTDVSFKNPNVYLKADSLSLDGPKEELRLLQSNGFIEGQKNDISFKMNEAKVVGPLFNHSTLLKLDSVWLLDPRLKLEAVSNPEESKQSRKRNVAVDFLSIASGDIEVINGNSQISLEKVSGTATNLVDTLGLENLKGLNLIGGISTLMDTLFISANWEYRGKSNMLTGRNVQTDFGDVSLIELADLNIEGLKSKIIEFDSLYVHGSDIEFHLEKTESKSQNPIAYHKISGENNNIKLSSSDFLLEANEAGFSIASDFKLTAVSTGHLSFQNSQFNIESERLGFPQGYKKLQLNAPELKSATNDIYADSLIIDVVSDTIDIETMSDFKSWHERLNIYSPVVNLNLKPQDDNKKEPLVLPALNVRNGSLDLTITKGEKYTHLSLHNFDIKGQEHVTVNNPDDWLSTIGIIDHFSLTTNNQEVDARTMKIRNGSVWFDELKSRIAQNSFTIESGQISDLKLITFDSEEPVTADSIELNGITLNIFDTTTVKPEKGTFRSILSNHLKTSNVDIIYHGNTQELKISNLKSEISPLIVDSEFNLPAFLESKVEVNSDSIYFNNYDMDRTFAVGSFMYDNQSNVLELSEFNTPQKLSRDSFMIGKTIQTNWMDIKAGNVLLSEFDLLALINNNGVRINSVEVRNPELIVYRDKALEESLKYQPILPVKILKSNIPIIVDSVAVRNGSIFIEQKFPDVADPAKLSFFEVNSKVRYIYSDTAMIRKHPKMYLYSTGKLLENAEFRTEVRFNMTDTLGKYNMNGTMTNGNLLVLNDMLEKAGHLRVNSGTNKSVDFKFKANNNYAVGEMKFIYDDLNVTIMDNENRDEGFKTFVANAFVIHTKNPHFLFLRKGDIYSERKLHKEVFNHWANSILSGVVSSIGVRNNKKEIKKLNKQSQKQFDND